MKYKNRSLHAKKRVRDSKGRFISKDLPEEESKKDSEIKENKDMNEIKTVKESSQQNEGDIDNNKSVKTVIFMQKRNEGK